MASIHAASLFADPRSYPDLFSDFAESPDIFLTKFPEYWSPYKTPVEKLEYEQRLPTEIQPFIRSYFQRHAAQIAHLLETETTIEYFRSLNNAWYAHLAVNCAIDCFLSYEIGNPIGEWSPTEWRTAKRLLIAAMETDHKKALYSSGLKAKLDRESIKLVTKYGKNDPSFENLLLTPSFLTFYEARDLDHKKYQLSVIQGNPDEGLKEQITRRYHAGDEGVFELRSERYARRVDERSLKQEILDEEVVSQKRAISKGYLSIERPDVKAFEALLKFDNATEYEHTYSLKGLPDLFLREEILRRATLLGEIAENTSLFSLSLDQLAAAIDRIISKISEHFTIELRPYRQHFDTCGTACVMSILNRKGLRLNEENELKIWELVGKPYNFPGGLAWILLRNGFNVTYVQDSPALLSRDNPEFAAMDAHLVSAARTYVDLHRKAIEAGLTFEIRDWDSERVKGEIERGNLCLLYLHVTDTMSHVVIARGIKGDSIEIIDPLGGGKYLPKEQLDRRIVHPMGKRLLIVKKLPNDLFPTLDSELTLLGY